MAHNLTAVRVMSMNHLKRHNNTRSLLVGNQDMGKKDANSLVSHCQRNARTQSQTPEQSDMFLKREGKWQKMEHDMK